jgi:hypothetical protein
MLSSDKNVETIAELVEVLKHYLGLQKEYLKLDVIDKVVRLLTATALAILFFLLIIAVLLFVSLGVGFWLSQYTGFAGAFFIIAAIHLGLLLLFVLFRKSWIERPLVRFLARLFMS